MEDVPIVLTSANVRLTGDQKDSVPRTQDLVLTAAPLEEHVRRALTRASANQVWTFATLIALRFFSSFLVSWELKF